MRSGSDVGVRGMFVMVRCAESDVTDCRACVLGFGKALAILLYGGGFLALVEVQAPGKHDLLGGWEVCQLVGQRAEWIFWKKVSSWWGACVAGWGVRGCAWEAEKCFSVKAEAQCFGLCFLLIQYRINPVKGMPEKVTMYPVNSQNMKNTAKGVPQRISAEASSDATPPMEISAANQGVSMPTSIMLRPVAMILLAVLLGLLSKR